LKFLLLPPEDPLQGITHDVRLFADVPPGHWVNVSPPKPPNNLPAVDHFTGRASDTFHVIQLVLASRLVTITGKRGVGKSALARAVGTYINDRRHFEQGVFLIKVGLLTKGMDSAGAAAGAAAAAAAAKRANLHSSFFPKSASFDSGFGAAGVGGGLLSSGLFSPHTLSASPTAGAGAAAAGGGAVSASPPVTLFAPSPLPPSSAAAAAAAATPPIDIAFELNRRIAKALCLDFTHHRQQRVHASRSAHHTHSHGGVVGGAAGIGIIGSVLDDVPPSVCGADVGGVVGGVGADASTTRLQQDPERLQHSLLSYLQDKHMLLLLDDADELLLNAAHRPAFKAWLKLFLDRTRSTHLLLTGNLANEERAAAVSAAVSAAVAASPSPAVPVVPSFTSSSRVPGASPPPPSVSPPVASPSFERAGSTVGQALHSAVGIPGHTARFFSLGPLHPLDAAALLVHRFPRELRAEERGRMRSLEDFSEQPLLQRLRGNPRLIEWCAECLNHLELATLTELLCTPVDGTAVVTGEGAPAAPATLAAPTPAATTMVPPPPLTGAQIASERMRFIEAHECWFDLSDEAQLLLRKLVHLLETGGSAGPAGAAAAAHAHSSSVSYANAAPSPSVSGTAVLSPMPVSASSATTTMTTTTTRPSPSPEGMAVTTVSSASAPASAAATPPRPQLSAAAGASAAAPPAAVSASSSRNCNCEEMRGEGQQGDISDGAAPSPPVQPSRDNSGGSGSSPGAVIDSPASPSAASSAPAPAVAAAIAASAVQMHAQAPVKVQAQAHPQQPKPAPLWSASSAFGLRRNRGLSSSDDSSSDSDSDSDSDGESAFAYDAKAAVLSPPVSGAHGDRMRTSAAASSRRARSHSQAQAQAQATPPPPASSSGGESGAAAASAGGV
jgi:hypothetical protein